MKHALSEADDAGTLTLVRKTQVADYYAHNNWTKLNSEMQGLLVQLREAENYAVRELCDKILMHWHSLRRNVSLTAELDVGTALAKAADELGYARPTVTESTDLEVVEGRHPVAEFELSKDGRHFVANTTHINDEQRVHVITGPNMGGKSTVLRQVGLIAAMAQAGSYVPAKSATIGVIDQLFARIRYSDNIAKGRSSFRVEMDDAAYILDNATERSLVLLDEFGRGTTADYAACIAEATVYALSHKLRARSLFATHLHDVYDIVQDKDLSPDNAGSGVAFFCTRMQADSTDEGTLQYRYVLELGINRDAEAFKVAQLAGYPPYLLERARSLYVKRSDSAA